MKVQDISFHFQLKLLMEASKKIIKHTPIKRSETEKAAMKALQLSIEKARAAVNQALRTLIFFLFAFPAFSQSINEIIMDPDPVAPVFYDYMSQQECYTLNEEWIINPYTGQQWTGYWLDGFFYSDDQRFYFTADSAYQEHWPSIDLWREEDFNPPSIYSLPFTQTEPELEVWFPEIKGRQWIEAGSWTAWLAGWGWLGAMEYRHRVNGHDRDWDAKQINELAAFTCITAGAAGFGYLTLADRSKGWKGRAAMRVIGGLIGGQLAVQTGYFAASR